MEDGAGQRKSLPHALRVLADTSRQIRIEADLAHGVAANLVVVNSIEPGEVAQVLHAAEFVVEQRRVSHVADAVRDLTNLLRTEDCEATLARLHQAGDDAQQGALAGAVIAEMT